jgi:hypothetical protein
MNTRVLMVVADCPGHFLETTYRMAERLRTDGYELVFAVTSTYYERFKGFSLDRFGPVHYVSKYLVEHQNDDRVDDVQLDYWLAHATFVRTRYFHGKHINLWDDYRRIVLFYRDLLDAYPDIAAVWSEMPSSATIRIAQAEATRSNLPFLGYIGARVPGYFNVVRDALGVELMANPAPPTSAAAAEPEYMRNPMATLTQNSVVSLVRGAASKLAQAGRSRGEWSIEMGDPLRVQVSWYRRQVQRKLYFRYMVPKSTFVALPDREHKRAALVFPLHYRPEASTSVQAQHFENDIETIRNIAFSLPHRTDLYVKEHPSAIGLHSRAFYQELRSFPNVRLLDIDPPLSRVVDTFDAVVTLTSTAGFEALQRGIPVVLLGRTFYEDYPGVTRIRGWEELPAVLRHVTQGTLRFPASSSMNLYLDRCFPGTFNYMSESVAEPQNISHLLRPLRFVLEGGAGG